MLVYEYAIYIFITILLHIGVLVLLKRKRKRSLQGRHVVVTGGSSGIGLWVAVYAAQLGAHVTIIARNKERLGMYRAKQFPLLVSSRMVILKIEIKHFSHLPQMKLIN